MHYEKLKGKSHGSITIAGTLEEIQGILSGWFKPSTAKMCQELVRKFGDRNLLSINKRLDWGRSVDVILFC